MGVCNSSLSQDQSRKKTGGSRGGGEKFRNKRGSMVEVIHPDGRMEELKHPTRARDITSQNPNCFLCSSESMSIGSTAPPVPDDEELQPDQLYFLLPLSRSRTPLSLPYLCALAIKASSTTTALAKHSARRRRGP